MSAGFPFGNREKGNGGSIGLEGPLQATGVGAQSMNDTPALPTKTWPSIRLAEERSHIPSNPMPTEAEATRLVMLNPAASADVGERLARRGSSLPGRFKTAGEMTRRSAQYALGETQIAGGAGANIGRHCRRHRAHRIR